MSARGESHVYPQRRRCLKCRNFFDFIVIKRLYCSYSCADMFDVSAMPVDQLPRQCSSFRGTRRVAKNWYDTPEQAEVDAVKAGTRSYYCNMHGCWHLGALRGEDS